MLYKKIIEYLSSLQGKGNGPARRAFARMERGYTSCRSGAAVAKAVVPSCTDWVHHSILFVSVVDVNRLPAYSRGDC